jgi:hypothetical protein
MAAANGHADIVKLLVEAKAVGACSTLAVLVCKGRVCHQLVCMLALEAPVMQ